MKQGEYFGNKYETHHQPDLTPEVMSIRYPKLKMIYSNNEYGYYITDKDQSKSDRAFVLYCTENYLEFFHIHVNTSNGKVKRDSRA